MATAHDYLDVQTSVLSEPKQPFMTDQDAADALFALQLAQCIKADEHDVMVLAPRNETVEQSSERAEAIGILNAAYAQIQAMLSEVISGPHENIDSSAVAELCQDLSSVQTSLLTIQTGGMSGPDALSFAKASVASLSPKAQEAVDAITRDHRYEMAEKVQDYYEQYSASFKRQLEAFNGFVEDNGFAVAWDHFNISYDNMGLAHAHLLEHDTAYLQTIVELDERAEQRRQAADTDWALLEQIAAEHGISIDEAKERLQSIDARIAQARKEGEDATVRDLLVEREQFIGETARDIGQETGDSRAVDVEKSAEERRREAMEDRLRAFEDFKRAALEAGVGREQMAQYEREFEARSASYEGRNYDQLAIIIAKESDAQNQELQRIHNASEVSRPPDKVATDNEPDHPTQKPDPDLEVANYALKATSGETLADDMASEIDNAPATNTLDITINIPRFEVQDEDIAEAKAPSQNTPAKTKTSNAPVLGS